MKFIEDVDTGEIIPIPDDAEEQVYDKMPTLYKDDSPDTPNIKYAVEPDSANLVDVIFNLQDELKEEKNKKTIYHKFPFVKIISAVAICTAIIVAGVFGIRYVSNIDFVNADKITVEVPIDDYPENIVYESSETDSANEPDSSEEEKQDNNVKKRLLSALSGLLLVAGIFLGAVFAFKIFIHFMRGY